MKQITFISFLFMAITMGLSDDIVENMARFFSMSRKDVQVCMDKAYVKVEDLMRIDQLIDDNVVTVEIDKSALKVGCLFACLLQKKEMMSGAHINEKKLKEYFNSPKRLTNSNMAERILDTCINRIKSKSDECEVTIKFFLCLVAEIRSSRREMQ